LQQGIEKTGSLHAPRKPVCARLGRLPASLTNRMATSRIASRKQCLHWSAACAGHLNGTFDGLCGKAATCSKDGHLFKFASRRDRSNRMIAPSSTPAHVNSIDRRIFFANFICSFSLSMV
jgi:hypothetical protein